MTLQTQGLRTPEPIRAFLDGAKPLDFKPANREAAYDLIVQTLRRFGYLRLGKTDRGLIGRYLCKVTGRPRQQATRLIAQFRKTGRIRDRRGPRSGPSPGATPARTSCSWPSSTPGTAPSRDPPPASGANGQAQVFGDPRFERPAGISNGRLYNLRHSTPYRRSRGPFAKTRPVRIAIGERRNPVPNGPPGYRRVDSVHRGDLDGIEGRYRIDLVDEVTQFQFIGSVERRSERFLLPVLEALVTAFPFAVRGFHADNGSESIDRQVAGLLNKLQVQEFTESRARRTNDNAPVESKNGSVIRRHLGYARLPGRCAQRVNDFTPNLLSPYLNFHRPGFFPPEEVDARGRPRKPYRYANTLTPYEKLNSLPEADPCLKPGIAFEQPDAPACAMSDNDAARHLDQARAQLFNSIDQAQTPAA